MPITTTLKALAAVALVAGFVSVPAQADTLPFCYAAVHDDCFLNEPNCSQEDYENALGLCDEMFGGDADEESSRPTRPERPGNLADVSQDDRSDAEQRAYERKLRRLHRMIELRFGGHAEADDR